jgi:predicted  nucleic acid-binding Zn-ribbon protein
MNVTSAMRAVLHDLVTPDLKQVQAHLDGLEDRMGRREAELDKRITRLETQIDKHESRMDRRFDAVTAANQLIPFSSLEARLSQLESQLKPQQLS